MIERNCFKLGLAAVVLGAATAASATPLVIAGLGANNWTSGDTRNNTGAQATQAQIDAQIKFLAEGVIVADAAGVLPDASPSGSLGGLGYLRLDGTDNNLGKSDIGYTDLGGIAQASALLSSDFSLSFRHLRDPNPTSRTVGQSISISNGTVSYTLSYVEAATGANTWLTSSITATTGGYYLYGAGASGASGPRLTLSEWAATTAWSYLFGDDFDVVRVGFNIGSSSRNGLVYIDWLQTSLLNGGDLIDFAAPTAVPEPQSLILVAAALAGVAVARRRRR